MASSGQEVELLKGGTNADAPSKGTVVLNMIHRQNAWEVRAGFGQMAQFDTLMGAWTHNSGTRDNGYRRVLGSTLIKAKSGLRHIVTVVAATVRTGAVEQDPVSSVEPIYCVLVYNIDTGAFWEEPIYRHTAENAGAASLGFDMTHWHGAFETTASDRHAAFPRAEASDEDLESVFFVEINNILYFGNPDIGLYSYIPTAFRKRRRRHLSTQYRGTSAPAASFSGYQDPMGHGSAPPYSECCFIKKVFATPPSDDLDAAYTYLPQPSFPSPSVAGRLGGRLVMAVGRTVFISDSGFPASVNALNVFVVPTDDDVTALAELGGTLYIFTVNEVWLMQPSAGPVVTKGRLIRIADGLGCAGPNAITRAGNSLAWVDSRGVYRMTGAAQIERVSDPIEPFFTGGLSNPLNSFFTDGGHVRPQQVAGDWPMPQSFWRYSSDMVSAAYNERLDATIFSFPAINAMMVLAGGQWSTWSTESVARELSESPVAGALQNIKRPWVMADETDIFVACGVDTQALVDGVGVAAHNSTNRSVALLRYGRGGAVDRSVEDEDFRSSIGSYKNTPNPAGTSTRDGGWYFQEPIPIEPGRIIPGTPAVVVTAGSVWVPVELVRPSMNSAGVPLGQFDDLELRFTFDNTHWLPVLANPVTAEIAAMFPPERASSISGYGVQGTTLAAGVREFTLYNSGTGAASATGDQIRISFDGPSATGAWNQKPTLNLGEFRRNRMFYIPFARVPGAGVAAHTVGMNIALTSSTVGRGGLLVNTSLRVWQGSFMGSSAQGSNSLAQPVDYAYKSGQIGMGDDIRRKARGVYARVLSHSNADPPYRVSPNWPTGVFNSVISSDFKGWVSQVLDVAPTSAAAAVSQILDTESVRTRYLTETGILRRKVFADDATTDHVRYGNAATTATLDGVYLVDDEEVDVIATSDSVKGSHHTVMIWGMLRNKAERLVLESVKAALRVVGGRYRGGR